MQSVRLSIRAAGQIRHRRCLPVLRGPPGQQALLGSRAAGRLRRSYGLQQSRSTFGWLLWRRWLRLSLSPLQQQLASLLAHRPPQQGDTAGRLPAAVAIILIPEPDSILLIRRAERPGDPWSGQIGFPGGRQHGDDADLQATAVRETAEEVGLDLSAGTQIGQLDDLAPLTPTPVPVLVRPFVFALDLRPLLVPNPEVARVLWTPLAELRRPGSFRPTTLMVRGEPRTYPAYHLGSDIVWGLTERILTPLLGLLPSA